MAYKRISPQPVVEGGTGAQTFTAHGVLIGEGTSAVAVTAAGTTGQVLTGVTGSDPVWASPASSSISITGDTGGALTGSSFTFTGGTTGLRFGGSVSTETLTFAGITANGGTVSLATDATTSTINVGTGAGVKTSTFGSTNSTSATTVQSGSGALNVTATGGALTINSGAGALSVSNDASATTLTIGTGAAVKTVTLGSTNSTSTTTVQSGSGALNITATGGALTVNSGAGALSISNDASATTLTIGTGAAVKTVTLGSTNSTSVTTIASGTGGCNVGTSANAHATTVGSTTASATTTIQGPSGGVFALGVAGVTPSNLNMVTINTSTGQLGSQAVSGGGVTGPGSSTDRAIATWNGTGGSALFNNSTAVISSGGIFTNSGQPCFLASQTTDQSNVTGDGTAYTVTFTNEIFDQGNNFDGTSTFTAPVTGRYTFSCNLFFDTINAASVNDRIVLNTSNATYRLWQFNAVTMGFGGGASLVCNGSAIVDMDAADTTTLTVAFAGGTKTTSVLGSTSAGYRVPNFSGFLIC